MTDHGIGEVVQRTGIAEATLRMWERRHGFPSPKRGTGGHRRYSDAEVEAIRRVAAHRAAGVSVAAAIERVRSQAGAAPPSSVFATLRRQRPDLEPRTLTKPLMLALTHAIEDETLARAEPGILFGSFQRERFFRIAQPRWRALSAGAHAAIAFADFARMRAPRGGPVELPVSREHPLSREWALVFLGEDFAVCLAGWEPLASSSSDRQPRWFEAIWSLEASVVQDAARICAAIAAARRPELGRSIQPRLDAPPPVRAESQLRLATAISGRAFAHLSSPVIRNGRTSE